MKFVLLLLCTCLCLPAVDYEAGIARVGGVVAAALTARQDKLDPGKEARLDAAAVAEMFKLLKEQLPAEQQNLGAEALARIADTQAQRMAKGYAKVLKALKDRQDADPSRPLRYLGCAFEVEVDNRNQACDSSISVEMALALPVKDGQVVLRVDATMTRIGDRFLLQTVGSPAFIAP